MTPGQRKNLERLLRPQCIALIGGSSAEAAARQLRGGNFEGEVWGVNPRRGELGGYACVSRVEDLPRPPDLVFLAAPADAAVETVAALNQMDAGGVVCFTAGFAELGEKGRALENGLVAAAGDMALVGPNCSGLLNFAHSAELWPFDNAGKSVQKGPAFISQSGMLGNTMALNQRSVAFSYIISAGNQAMLGIEDFIDVLIDDDRVPAIGIYVEGLKDVYRFAEIAARALVKGVPIVALKAGKSEIGARLTVSHTGSLSGADDLYQALFNRLGVIRVATPIALLETLKLLSTTGAPKGRRVAAFTCSGGDALMLADAADDLGLEFPQPSEAVAAEMTAQLPPIATVCNPLDYTTPLWGHTELLETLFETTLRDPYDAALIVQDYPIGCPPETAKPYLEDGRALAAAARKADIPAVVCSVLSETIDTEIGMRVINQGAAPMQGIDEALGAIARAAAFSEHRHRYGSAEAARNLSLQVLPPAAADHVLLDEWTGKKLVAEAGVPIPTGRLSDAAGAPKAAVEIGFPVVVKLVDAALPHKTEARAVRLGLNSEADVAEAVAAIKLSVADHAPDLKPENFLVERMISGAIAEILVGIRRDEQFGLALVIGSGGRLVELVGDARTLLLPTSRDAVSEALSSLKVSALLEGFRGAPAGDREAVVEAVLLLTHFAQKHYGELDVLDVNPLMVLEDGVVALDVMLRMAG